MEKFKNKYWCDKCRKIFFKDVFNDDDNCPCCKAEFKHTHMLFRDEDDNLDFVVVTKENYKNILPKELFYFYNELNKMSMTFSELNIVNYSISKNAIFVNGKWYKTH